jgi:tyrosinase
VHINYTLSIHESGIFLAWHRQFVYLWETALREECGYKGYQPYLPKNFSAALKSKLIGDPRYWDWPLWAADLAASPLFDGSETSLSGDGAFNGTVIPVNLGEYSLPGGSGGGCVTSGPFKNLTLSLGPFDFGLAFGTSIPSNAFQYKPPLLLTEFEQLRRFHV